VVSEIYFFSGSGNSLLVARDLAERTGAALIPLASLEDRAEVVSKADSVGIVFPAYDFKAPKIVERFVSKLTLKPDAWLFAVATCGITPLGTLKKFAGLLSRSGKKLSAGFAVVLPHNAVGSDIFSAEENAVKIAAWDARADAVAAAIRERRTMPPERTGFFRAFLLSGMVFRAIPKLAPFLWHLIRHGAASLAFRTADSCNGCGTCSRSCPVLNIVMDEGRPRWEDHCEGCFACWHACPKAAIRVGSFAAIIPQYRHPRVKLKEIAAQRGRRRMP
jgi:ferredoxin/flavodoxin